jgi:DNA-binding NarL/FixJ family response regulator
VLALGRSCVSDLIRVVVADDHPLFRQGVVMTLNSVEDFQVVGQAADATATVQLVNEELPDIALLDVTMPGGGISAANRIASVSPGTKVIMLTVSEDEDDLVRAMQAGAKGYVLKGIAVDELVSLVRAIFGGEVYVAPGLAWVLLREMSDPESVGPLAELSTRERRVLELVASGLNNQEIGVRLGLAEKTIKHYMTSILGKLQVRTRVEAALLAARSGFPKI